MNKRGFFPGIMTIVRIFIGVIVYIALTKMFASTPMPESWIWKISLAIVVGAGLLSFKLLPIF